MYKEKTMKTIAKLTPIALMVSALVSTGAMADPANLEQGSTFNKTADKTFTDDAQIFYFNDVSVEIDKSIDVSKTGNVKADINFTGEVVIQSFTQALLDNKQININNMDTSIDTDNDSEIKLDGTVGNVGANAAAGNYNQQKNDVAIAVSDSPDVFQWLDAETFTYQDTEHNSTKYETVTNIADTVITGGNGNIGSNSAAGTGNEQSNALAAAVGVGILAEATGYIKQQADNNDVTNNFVENEAFLQVSNFTGNLGSNVAAGVNNQQANSLSISVSRQGIGVGSIIAP
jgi:hypothetical protein